MDEPTDGSEADARVVLIDGGSATRGEGDRLNQVPVRPEREHEEVV